MVAASEKLDELISLSNELATQLGKPTASPVPAPKHKLLHPDLVDLLRTGLFAWQEQGIDLSQVREFTKKAADRGLRRQVWVFGWHPKGGTWWAVPLYYKDDVVILKFDRHNRLTETEMDIDGFLEEVARETRIEIEKVQLAEPDPEEIARAAAEARAEQPKKEMRLVRVDLPESAGGTVRGGDRTEAFTGEELAYIVWSLTGLQMLSEGAGPDLSAWDARVLRRMGLDEVPSEGDARWAEYRENWLRVSRRDRTAPPVDRAHIGGHKLTVPGEWYFAASELAMLRRNRQAKAPRHRPDAAQAAIWERFMVLCEADEVELHIA